MEFPEELLERLPEHKRKTVLELLRQDPRPGTTEAVDKEYRMLFGGYDIWFRMVEDRIVVTNCFEKENVEQSSSFS